MIRQADPDRPQGRRPRPVRQVVRHRGQARRRGTADHEGKRHHGRAGLNARIPRGAARQSCVRKSPPDYRWTVQMAPATTGRQTSNSETRATHAARRRYSRQCGQGDARPQGPQRRHRQELRRPPHHQGRRHRRQGDRARGQVREHGRADGARGRLRRPTTPPATAPPPRPCWRGHRPRRRQVGGRRHEPDGPQARHRHRGHRRGQGHREARQEGRAPRPKSPRSAPSRRTAMRPSAR